MLDTHIGHIYNINNQLKAVNGTSKYPEVAKRTAGWWKAVYRDF